MTKFNWNKKKLNGLRPIVVRSDREEFWKTDKERKKQEELAEEKRQARARKTAQRKGKKVRKVVERKLTRKERIAIVQHHFDQKLGRRIADRDRLIKELDEINGWNKPKPKDSK